MEDRVTCERTSRRGPSQFGRWMTGEVGEDLAAASGLAKGENEIRWSTAPAVVVTESTIG